ncbi:hypothetical protein L4D11_02380 [Vibrio gigantis]|uniref:hypothetical protein n=1 Tax=Vibrio gigantis TaxID=296199 RepID=UPI003D103655
MARRGSGLRTAIRVVKAIDKANKRSIRESEKRRKAVEREELRAERERIRRLKDVERTEKKRASEVKRAFKESLVEAKDEYNDRCLERSSLRKQFIKEVLK